MNSNAHLEQLGALAWLKWRLFRNALRSRRAALNSAASILGTLAALFLSLLVAIGVGFAAYGLASETAPTHAVALRGGDAEPLLLLFGMLTLLYMMWAFVPLTAGGGTQFDPGQLLLYPVSLRKLFVIDLASELTSLASIFAIPAILAIGLGAGAASGHILRGLAASAFAAAFGIALAKLFSTTITVLMRTRRRRGEGLLAIVGVVVAFSGVLLQFGLRAVDNVKTVPAAIRWTPPGAFATALTVGSHKGGEATYALAVLTLAAYAFVAAALTYRVAVGALNSSGGAGRSRTALVADALKNDGCRRISLGWQLPLVSAEVSAVFEKELRYALRNAQLRTMIIMPVVMTLALRLGVSPRHNTFSSFPASVAPYLEGARAAFSNFYVLIAMTTLAANFFGYEGAGMRAYVLAPVSRRAILLGKNLVMFALSIVSAVAVTLLNQVVFRDVSPRALGFAALAFIFFAATFASAGNSISVRFPKRLRYGKRAGASGFGGLLMIPLFLVALAAPALAVIIGWSVGSVLVEYVILASFACAAVVVYLSMLNGQGRELARRELDILEAVAKRDDD
ncbi:MAG: type transport system permease protein [Acidobacteriota bacterium]|nr:type transport system permease protein [Acidobacteriota bacterium]